ncbi:type II secretion system minor pseudopilin [Acanthopleuribacter pedis]|uniref:General secretion pathway protein GspK n=1 Tax=Acanthopleuribacter pedis TaxID=442870 RepID=A0A8J7Q731_9BACT|nr:type II secretion system protein GspK [Acanthopleuribacter pedis]MBO1319047.1 general secretion pathway protein GspK [Acanthopleuribacter pedis]
MHPSDAQRGNILITVLWIIMIMAVVVLGLNYEARSDVERTMLFRDRARAYWLARGAIERAKYDYALSKMSADEEVPQRTKYRYDFDHGYAVVQILNHTHLMSINSANRDLWVQLFAYYEMDETEADILIDSIFDWVDEDDLPRLNGVEEEHYLGLNPPYFPRNGEFHSVEELLLVNGMTEDLFYGTPGGEKPGLRELLTAKGPRITKFDINTCPTGMLMAFLGITREEANQVKVAREIERFETVIEAGELFNGEINDKLMQFFTVYQGNQFKIRATGYVNDSVARYTVEDEVRFSGGERLFTNLSHKDFSLKHVDETPQVDADVE